jgi:hypothetical protein
LQTVFNFDPRAAPRSDAHAWRVFRGLASSAFGGF